MAGVISFRKICGSMSWQCLGNDLYKDVKSIQIFGADKKARKRIEVFQEVPADLKIFLLTSGLVPSTL